MFIATCDGPMERLAARLLKNPERIDIAGKQVSLNTIDQRLLRADDLGTSIACSTTSCRPMPKARSFSPPPSAMPTVWPS